MSDLGGDLAVEAAKELVKAIMTGMVGLAKKFPALWRRSRKTQRDQVVAQLERSTAELTGMTGMTGPELERAMIRNEAAWEVLIRGLLAESRQAHDELRELVTLIVRESRNAAPLSQQNFATGNATINAVLKGNQTIIREDRRRDH